MNEKQNGISYARQIAIDILSIFEDMLEENDILIPNEDRKGSEDEAPIYGSTYSELQDTLTQLLAKCMPAPQARSSDSVPSKLVVYQVYEMSSDDNYPQLLLSTTDKGQIAPVVAKAYADCGEVTDKNASYSFCDEQAVCVDWRSGSCYKVWTDEIEVDIANKTLLSERNKNDYR